jgi:hypothetical protein
MVGKGLKRMWKAVKGNMVKNIDHSIQAKAIAKEKAKG